MTCPRNRAFTRNGSGGSDAEMRRGEEGPLRDGRSGPGDRSEQLGVSNEVRPDKGEAQADDLLTDGRTTSFLTGRLNNSLRSRREPRSDTADVTAVEE
ncbi:unnamed protein product [Arctogadus glacialis]